MNIGAVIEYLNKTYGYDLNSSYYTYIAHCRVARLVDRLSQAVSSFCGDAAE